MVEMVEMAEMEVMVVIGAVMMAVEEIFKCLFPWAFGAKGEVR
jgi:hypothetical protein